MDEILVNNFMVFADLVENEPYDLWVGRRGLGRRLLPAREPRAQAGAVRLDDRLRGLAADAGRRTAREALTADYNAEMIEQIARFPALRDRALFVGNPDDVVPDGFGDGLPPIRDWIERNFDFSGYVTGFDPGAFADRAALRAELGYRPDEQVCVVTVGGSGVGKDLLRRVIAAFPAAKRARAGTADGRGDRAADRPGVGCPQPTASRCAATCTTCTGTWPPATWPSCRAG